MKIAVITAFTRDFLDQFKLFISSLRHHNKIPVIALIYEDDNQNKINVNKYECIGERLCQQEADAFTASGDRWIQWHKADIIQKIVTKYELDMALWLDCDTIITSDISPIFDHIHESFTVVNDYFAPLTTLNKPQLYDVCPSANHVEERPLNSGVVGFYFPRDAHILTKWSLLSNLAVKDTSIRQQISLYDQGTLIWALKELDLLDQVIDRPEWNYAAKRNAYEANPSPKWPIGPQTMGGDLFAQIGYDNPGAVVVHYAGYPKLTDLLIHNHNRSTQHNKRRNATLKISDQKIFVVGLERAGTHTLSEVLRRSAKQTSWIRHEANLPFDHLNVDLCKAALAKYQNTDYDYQGYIDKRIKYYDRQDVNIVSDSNHRLAFFVEDLKSSLPESKFILSLRSPLSLIRSRLLNFSVWSDLIHKYPLEYQMDLFKIHTHFKDGSYGQNAYRLRPLDTDVHDWAIDIIGMHVWEVTTTIRTVMNQFVKMSSSDYCIVWIDDLPSELPRLKTICGQKYFDYDMINEHAHRKYGKSSEVSIPTLRWISQAIQDNTDLILSEFNKVLSECDINYADHLLI